MAYTKPNLVCNPSPNHATLPTSPKRISILGATGSIGNSTLKVVAQHKGAFEVFALSAHTQVEKLVKLCQQFTPRYAVIGTSYFTLAQDAFAQAGLTTELLAGDAGLEFIASHEDVDMVMAAIVGAAGLPSTLAALKAAKRVLLANKEALIMAGELMLEALKTHGGQLLPVDSEHNAIFQSLPCEYLDSIHQQGGCADDFGVSHVSLTASGGPFLHTPLEKLTNATAAMACNHPNWSMGQKISVDSATMMNKGLELIEASLLFGLDEARITVVVHPQSVLHSAVHYTDGSVVGQLGQPDMCTPIASCMAWPQRLTTQVAPLDFTALGELTFFKPDLAKFSCLKLARDAITHSQAAVVALNAANEVAVHAFLQERIGFLQITALNADILENFAGTSVDKITNIEDVLAVDGNARTWAGEWVAQSAAK